MGEGGGDNEEKESSADGLREVKVDDIRHVQVPKTSFSLFPGEIVAWYKRVVFPSWKIEKKKKKKVKENGGLLFLMSFVTGSFPWL